MKPKIEAYGLSNRVICCHKGTRTQYELVKIFLNFLLSQVFVEPCFITIKNL